MQFPVGLFPFRAGHLTRLSRFVTPSEQRPLAVFVLAEQRLVQFGESPANEKLPAGQRHLRFDHRREFALAAHPFAPAAVVERSAVARLDLVQDFLGAVWHRFSNPIREYLPDGTIQPDDRMADG